MRTRENTIKTKKRLIKEVHYEFFIGVNIYDKKGIIGRKGIN